MAKGKLRLNVLQSSILPAAFVQRARAIYDAHKHDVDQFVDNVFPSQNIHDVVVQTTPIKNVLYVNSAEGRAPHHRTY